jgi:hypothetical protein
MAYRKVMALASGIEVRQVAPVMARANAILDDVKTVTAKVKGEAERVEHAIHATMNRIDDTAGRMRSNVRAKASMAVGIVRGLRVAIEVMRRSRSQAHEDTPQHEHTHQEETTWQTDTIDSTATKAAATS